MLYGRAGADRLNGADGNDTLMGAAGVDVLEGGLGSDRLVGGAGADVFAGDGGIDYVDYATRSADVTASIDETANDGETGENDNITPTVERIRGGAGNDTLVGDAAANVLYGGAGNDLLIANAGNDVLYGEQGDDTLNAQGDPTFTDRLFCGADIDSISSDPSDIKNADCEP